MPRATKKQEIDVKTPPKKPKRKSKAKKTKTPKVDIPTDPEPEQPEPVVESEPVAESEKKIKPKKKKRSFRLYGFNPENGRAPKNGGYYSATSPQLSAKKAANRWVIGKDLFDEVITFSMREVTSGSSKSVYEFKAKRVKLDKPKTYKRGDKEITVNSKIVIVD